MAAITALMNTIAALEEQISDLKSSSPPNKWQEHTDKLIADNQVLTDKVQSLSNQLQSVTKLCSDWNEWAGGPELTRIKKVVEEECFKSIEAKMQEELVEFYNEKYTKEQDDFKIEQALKLNIAQTQFENEINEHKEKITMYQNQLISSKSKLESKERHINELQSQVTKVKLDSDELTFERSRKRLRVATPIESVTIKYTLDPRSIVTINKPENVLGKNHENIEHYHKLKCPIITINGTPGTAGHMSHDIEVHINTLFSLNPTLMIAYIIINDTRKFIVRMADGGIVCVQAYIQNGGNRVRKCTVKSCQDYCSYYHPYSAQMMRFDSRLLTMASDNRFNNINEKCNLDGKNSRTIGTYYTAAQLQVQAIIRKCL
jgi:hypothetical protein